MKKTNKHTQNYKIIPEKRKNEGIDNDIKYKSGSQKKKRARNKNKYMELIK